MLRKGIHCQHKVRTKICEAEKLSWFRITDLSDLSIAMVKKFDQLHKLRRGELIYWYSYQCKTKGLPPPIPLAW